MENTLKLPTLSARVYRELLRGLYAEPGFSDVTESDIAKKLGVTIRQVHGAVCKLIKSKLVHFSDMQTSMGEEILYADIWRGDYDVAKAAKAAHLAMLDEQLQEKVEPVTKLEAAVAETTSNVSIVREVSRDLKEYVDLCIAGERGPLDLQVISEALANIIAHVEALETV